MHEYPLFACMIAASLAIVLLRVLVPKDAATETTSFCGRKLTAHASCVNYLTFSRKDGRWLASAGDGAFPLLIYLVAVR